VDVLFWIALTPTAEAKILSDESAEVSTELASYEYCFDNIVDKDEGLWDVRYEGHDQGTFARH
jgi:hypothetical protein